MRINLKKRAYIDESFPIINYENTKFKKDFQNSTRSIYINIEWAPCKNNNDDNANYPCIKYYESLSNYLLNIQLHICFHNFENIFIDEAYCTNDGNNPKAKKEEEETKYFTNHTSLRPTKLLISNLI
ncbi:hypothetical protein PIROE2DRAFT_3016 [Piromyces sp. E2]|nr:hypothetical protein PIROE2DRAFT_3016 [Piromyces sp. E2]|eukprot:OUM69123.1 hypothetical protein PIROE2DRAFT_3016 [Piromyces sp. E2]